MKFPLTLILLAVLFSFLRVASITLPPTETNKTHDIISAGYTQCRTANEVCSTNNDCCSNCCTSFTYSAMTCQDECPNSERGIDRANGNVVWKSKKPEQEKEVSRDSTSLVRDKIGSLLLQTHSVINENKNSGKKIKNNSESNNKQEVPLVSKKVDIRLGEREPKTKPNKDIGIKIIDDDEPKANSSDTHVRENVEVGLSVIDNNEDTNEDSGENKNTDIGTPIIRLGDKVKQDDSKENLNTDIGTEIIKIVEKSKKPLEEKMKNVKENVKHAHSKENKRDSGDDIISVQAIKKEKAKIKDQRFNNIKELNNKTLIGPNENSTELQLKYFTTDTNTTHNKSQLPTTMKANNTMKNNTTKSNSPSCTGITCDTGISLVQNIKEIINQMPNLLPLNPSQATNPSRKPVCKAAGSSCQHPSQCCSQCCAVSDGAFTCFDKGTVECQSWVPGKTAPQCKKPGETCETHGECCLKQCTDCGTQSKCDNRAANICRVEGNQVMPAVRTKLCKSLGDICGEASECCSQCCAVSDGVFKCFEEGTHECQPGDNVSNTTISEVLDVGFAN